MTSICSEAVGGLQQLTRELEEAAAEYGMEISSDKSKILVDSVEPMPSAATRMGALRGGPVWMLGLLANQ